MLFTTVGQSSSADASQNIQTMRLRDDPPPITQPQRASKKRKTPPNGASDQQQQQQQQQQPGQPQVLPPLMHMSVHPLLDYTSGGILKNPLPGHPGPPMQQPPQPQPPQQQQQQGSQSPPPNGKRQLSSSKRAEQNRKAQRNFRERRDLHVKALEGRSQLLEAALQSADEANRRWEECRALVDQLRLENAALRAALSQGHLLGPHANNPNAQPMGNNGAQQQQQQQEDPKTVDPSNGQVTNDGAENSAEQKQD